MKKHQKRLTIPRRWKLAKKTQKWAPKTSPGPHSKEWSVPVLVVLRDMLELCDNASEARKILAARDVFVDGKVITNPNHPVGFMDVFSIPKNNIFYRVLFDKRGKLVLTSIPKENSIWKMVKIMDKKTLKGNKIQLNLHDGRNILLEKDRFKTKDVLKIEIPSQKMLGAYKFSKGNLAMIIGGAHAGSIYRIEDFTVTKSSKPNIVTLEGGISTIMDYIFVIGKKTPEITVPEVKVI
ncbi:MAG: 30S ribosomal protein S4e [Candidatus Thermoplasmatota archaeon]|nr:30S ribosomal protein S4e [Candidatus Thermoplasmatota archaeon]MDP7264517.1 30S ribosomal protein S4e [Candidatus Thermoplasmatota archaeon]